LQRQNNATTCFARMNCRGPSTSRATGYIFLQSPSYHPSYFPFIRTDHSSSTRHSFSTASLDVSTWSSNDRPSSHLCLRTASFSHDSLRFPHAVLSLTPLRSIAVSLVPKRSRVSSLLPPARADHVLFSRSTVGHAFIRCYRAQLVLRVC